MEFRIIRPPLHKDFELPTREDLLLLRAGNIVKVMIQTNNEPAERVWVKITDCLQDNDWLGILDTDPLGKKLSSQLSSGDRLRFHPLDIIQIFEEDKSET